MAKLHNVNDRDELVKVLGLRWNVKEDHVYFGYKPLPKLSENQITKREILRRASKIYDPLGMLSPVTVRSKIFLQDLWNRKLDWDEIIP